VLKESHRHLPKFNLLKNVPMSVEPHFSSNSKINPNNNNNKINPPLNSIKISRSQALLTTTIITTTNIDTENTRVANTDRYVFIVQ